MLAGTLEARGNSQKILLALDRSVRSQANGGDARLSGSEGASLVHDERVHLLENFQGLGVLYQHARACAASHSHHDGHGSSQAERAGAGDDQDGDRVDQRIGEARLRSDERPDKKCRHRGENHGRNEIRGDDIGKTLNGGASCAGHR